MNVLNGFETSKNSAFEKLSPINNILNKYRIRTPEFTQISIRIFNIELEIIEISRPLYDYPINVISLYDTLTYNVIVVI